MSREAHPDGDEAEDGNQQAKYERERSPIAPVVTATLRASLRRGALVRLRELSSSVDSLAFACGWHG
jgi:hypothetical protein